MSNEGISLLYSSFSRHNARDCGGERGVSCFPSDTAADTGPESHPSEGMTIFRSLGRR